MKDTKGAEASASSGPTNNPPLLKTSGGLRVALFLWSGRELGTRSGRVGCAWCCRQKNRGDSVPPVCHRVGLSLEKLHRFLYALPFVAFHIDHLGV